MGTSVASDPGTSDLGTSVASDPATSDLGTSVASDPAATSDLGTSDPATIDTSGLDHPSEADHLPLIVMPAFSGKDDSLLLHLEDEDEEDDEDLSNSGPPLITDLSGGVADTKPMIEEASSLTLDDKKDNFSRQHQDSVTKGSFRPLIEVVGSHKVDEDEASGSGGELKVSSIVKKEQRDRAGSSKKAVSFSIITEAAEEDQKKEVREESQKKEVEGVGEWEDHKKEVEGIKSDDAVSRDQWATAVKLPFEQKGSVHQDKTTLAIVEDIEICPPDSPPINETPPTSSFSEPLPLDTSSDFKLSDVPIVSPFILQEVNQALERIEGKRESDLTEEDKVWKLAVSGGSTDEHERDGVELDAQTKERLKHTLEQTGATDKVSLKF